MFAICRVSLLYFVPNEQSRLLLSRCHAVPGDYVINDSKALPDSFLDRRPWFASAQPERHELDLDARQPTGQIDERTERKVAGAERAGDPGHANALERQLQRRRGQRRLRPLG